ncbi:putative glutamine-dependent NAD(+) synthetase [Bienertia sinuspersici]
MFSFFLWCMELFATKFVHSGGSRNSILCRLLAIKFACAILLESDRRSNLRLLHFFSSYMSTVKPLHGESVSGRAEDALEVTGVSLEDSAILVDLWFFSLRSLCSLMWNPV